MEFRSPAGGYRFPEELMHPPVMALGDSLYNGMRSATINAEFAAKSVPALVANVLAPNERFRWPRYPESLLINVEELLRQVSYLNVFQQMDTAISYAKASAERYFSGAHRPRTAETCAWDNLAISGAEVTHLIDISYEAWDQKAAKIMPDFLAVQKASDLAKVGGELMNLHMALNARFLLNPEANPALNALRPIDLVAARKPKTLLINIGPNHGIIDITLGGSEAPHRRGEETGLRSLARWADEEMPRMAAMLVNLPPETQHIVINTLPLPSTVPNQMYPYNPTEIEKHRLRDSEDDYFPIYENRLGGPDDYTQYTGEEMRALDQAVSDLNERMIDNVRDVFAAAGDTRVQFFRLDQVLKRYDGKHVDEKKLRENLPTVNLEDSRRAYSNEAVTIDEIFFWEWLREGGVGSLDNHHPSGLGYSLFAHALVQFLAESQPGIDLTKSVVSELGDRMLSDPPDAYMNVFRILYKVRRHYAGFPIQPDLAEALGKHRSPPDATLTDIPEQAEPLAIYVKSILGHRS